MGPSGFPRGRSQRRMRNLLLDRRFQLKYTGYLVGIALFVSVSLGLMLWRTGQSLIEQSRASVALGEQVVERGKKVLSESEKVNAVVRMSIVETYSDNPSLLEVFQGEAKSRDDALSERQGQLERNSADLRNRSASIERQYLLFASVIVLALVFLVVVIGLAGVVVTHRIAGPVHKMKRLLGELAKGHFRVVARLRKGDELKEFFDTFNRAARELSRRQESEIGEIDNVISLLRESGEDGAAAGAAQRLQLLRDSMRTSLATIPPDCQ